MTDSELFLVDIGANLTHSSFSRDLDDVIRAARENCVGHIMVTGTDLESISAAIELCHRYPGYLTCTAGFHPHVASSFDSAAYQGLVDFAQCSEVVAIGETGLDFNRNYSPPAAQERAFEQQLSLACDIGKPVFLHQRDAHSHFLSILKTHRPQLSGGVVHCFTDSRQALFDYLDLDMYIGITGWICDERRGRSLQEMVSLVPDDRLLLETDAPYLLPRTLNPPPASRRNEPRYLPEILRTLAQCRNQTVETLARCTASNANRLFSLNLDLNEEKAIAN